MYLSQSHLAFPLNHHTEQQLKTLSNKVKDHRMRMRLLAVAHFKAGKNRAEVARTLNVSRRMVNEWVANYLKGGISALESKKPSGRPSLLTEQQKAELVEYIEKQSQSCKGGRLNGEMLQRYIQQVFTVNYHQNSIYPLLKSLGISWTTSRSKHPKQSLEAQEEFKKTAN
jgi:transposase